MPRPSGGSRVENAAAVANVRGFTQASREIEKKFAALESE
jgi:hypothetical protein